MGEFKYIIVKSDLFCEVAIIFSKLLDHSKIASAFRKDDLVAAGKGNIGLNENNQLSISVYGDSFTLGGLKNRGKEDETLIYYALRECRGPESDFI